MQLAAFHIIFTRLNLNVTTQYEIVPGIGGGAVGI